MTPDQSNILRAHVQGLREAIEARHRDALAAYTMEIAAHERYAALLLQDAPAADVAPHPFPDERHLYPGGSLGTQRGVGYRPRRWRGDEVEYLYKPGGNLRVMAHLSTGTVDTNGQRWVTVAELIRCREFGQSPTGAK